MYSKQTQRGRQTSNANDDTPRGAGVDRMDRVQAIKRLIASDEYDTPDRVDAAIDALARDLQETRQTDKTP